MRDHANRYTQTDLIAQKKKKPTRFRGGF